MGRVTIIFAMATMIGQASWAQSTDYHGYWRLGLNTDAGLLDEAPDSQGEHKLFYDIPTSRHVNSPNYFWLQVAHTTESGAKAVIKVGNEGILPHENGNWAGASGDSFKGQVFDVRDLYLQLPVGKDWSIWAGSRLFEFEDIRALDVLNPFNVNGHGLGADIGNLTLALSMTKETLDGDRVPVTDKNGKPVSNTTKTTAGIAPELSVDRKNTTALVRYELKLGTGVALKPMVKVTRYGKAPKDETNANFNRGKVKGASGYTIGGVLSTWDDSGWMNYLLWHQSKPVDTTGETSGSDSVTGLGLSGTKDYSSSFGALMGIWLQNETYKQAKTVYKVSQKNLVVDGTKTTKSNFKASIDVQPVYYLTKNHHLALDLNHTTSNKITCQCLGGATLITPIYRYSMKKDPVGVPHIYVSVTHGRYAWKAKKAMNGKMTDELITGQSGFEIWF